MCRWLWICLSSVVLAQPAAEEFTLDPAVVKDYVGKYELGPNMMFDVTEKDGALYIKLGNQPPLPVRPKAKDAFDFKAAKAEFHFNRNGDGKVVELVLHQHGLKQSAPRHIEGVEAIAGPLDGNWLGTLEFPGTKLRLVLIIKTTSSGKLKAVAQSPDQGGGDIPVDEINFDDPKFSFKITLVGASFEGVYYKESNEITGTFKQGAASLPVTFESTEVVAKPKRPQEPKAPFPYEVTDVQFTNKKDDVTLAGTLTTPRGDGPFPAVVLISGSGPQNRDEELLGHKPFLVLADHFTRNGIAVLRYDDRGVGESTGNFEGSTSEDFSWDAQAGVEWLKTQEKIHPGKIGLAGHSEGGLIAPMVAARSSDVGFIVLMAGPGVNGMEVLALQQDLIAKANGASENYRKNNSKILKGAFDVLGSESDTAKASEKMHGFVEEYLQGLSESERDELGMTDEAVAAQIRQFNSPWFRFFLKYDPKTSLAKTTCPVLAINGAKDLQVDAEQNLTAIEAALKAGGNASFKMLSLPNLNHLFQTSKTGSPNEYSQIEETMSPVALKAMSDWILTTMK